MYIRLLQTTVYLSCAAYTTAQGAVSPPPSPPFVCEGDQYGELSGGACCIREDSFSPLRFSSSLGHAVIRRSFLGGTSIRCSSTTYNDVANWQSYGWGPKQSWDPCNNGRTVDGNHCCIEDSDTTTGNTPANIYLNNVATTQDGFGTDVQIDLRITALSEYQAWAPVWNGKDRDSMSFGTVNLLAPVILS